MMENLKQLASHVEHGITPTTYASGITTMFLGLNVEQWGILACVVGIVFTVLTYATNVYFKHKGK